MILIKKIDTLKELDELLPVILAFHAQMEFYSLYSASGFIGFITMNFFSNDFGIWICKKDNEIIGYTIVFISYRFFEKECTIIDAYIKENNESITSIGFETIENWAKAKECKYLSCYTLRDIGIGKKYGFKNKFNFMTKEI